MNLKFVVFCFQKKHFSLLRRIFALAAGLILANQGSSSATAQEDLEEITLQLQWFHQFQFAGYYAAAEKGFYEDAGLEVFITEIASTSVMGGVEEVLSGRANFGVSYSNVVFSRLRGKPVVVLAAIFQHSPAALIARAESGVTNLHDILSAKVGSLGIFNQNPDITGMFLKEGIPFPQFEGNYFPYNDNLDKLIGGQIDVIPGYLTDQPFALKNRGVPFLTIQPSSYGFDFYGDCLYTSESELEDHPERTAKFLEASLLGWEYAMANTEEIIDLILDTYDVENKGKSRESMRFEAEVMRKLILPDLVQIGHMNPGRWKHMADTYVDVGLVPESVSLEGFIYDPEKFRLGKYFWLVNLLFWSVVAIAVISLFLFLFNHRLRSYVKKRTAELEKSREQYRQEVLNRRIAESNLVEENARYRSLFEQSPISLWEEDFSGVKKYIDELKESGVSDFREFFNNNPESVLLCLALVKILDVNQATIELFGAKTKDELMEGLSILTTEDSAHGFREEFIALAEGKTRFTFEMVGKSLKGVTIPSIMNFSFAEGYEDTWGKVILSLFDQTDKKKSEKFLRDSENRLRTILDTAAVGVVSINEFGFIESLNHTASNIFGYTREELVGKNINLLMPEPDHSKHDGYLRKYRDTGKNNIIGFGREVIAERKNGEKFHMDLAVSEAYIGGRRIFNGIVRDISDRKNAEEELKKTRERLELALKGADLGLWAFNPRTLEASYNDQWAKMLGYDLREIDHDVRFFRNAVHPDDFPKMRESWNEHEAGKKPFYQVEIRMRAKDGRWVWIFTHGKIFDFDENGKALLAAGIHQDISERKSAEERLEEALIRHELALKGANLGPWDINIQSDEAVHNEHWANMLGYELEDVEQSIQFFNDCIHPDDLANQQKAWQAHQNGETPFYEAEMRMRTKDGKWKWIHGHGKIFEWDDAGNPLRAAGTHQDISKRKKAEEELAHERRNLENIVKARTSELTKSLEQIEDANRQLQEANRHRIRFISSMSHELRTPLTAILGFAELFGKQGSEALGNVNMRYIENIENAGKHLLILINDLLDLARIDAEVMETDLEEILVTKFMDNMISLMRIQLHKKRLTIKLNIDPSLRSATADRRKFEQIMFNLLSNACKYSPMEGQIGICALDGGNGFLKVEVSDSGVGIDKKEIDVIFKEFHQSDKIRDRDLGGAGIGLALTRRLVKLHGGQIGVESEIGIGSTFWFTLPFKKLERSADKKSTVDQSGESVKMVTGRRILVVEDSEVLLALLLDMLSLRSHDVAVAHNGREALEVAPQHHPELILMDMRMPVMGGLEATRRLREMPEFANTPIIALTASTGSEAEVRQIALGCTGHLAKPVNTDELFAIIERHLSNDIETIERT